MNISVATTHRNIALAVIAVYFVKAEYNITTLLYLNKQTPIFAALVATNLVLTIVNTLYIICCYEAMNEVFKIYNEVISRVNSSSIYIGLTYNKKFELYKYYILWFLNDLFPNLERLIIYRHQLPTKIPTSILYLELQNIKNTHDLPFELPPNLECLNLQGILLKEVPSLPSTLTGLTLKHIPTITTLPYKLPPELTKLELYRIPVEKMPPLPQTLTFLKIRSTKINKIPDLPDSLNELYLHHEDWKNNPLYPNLFKMLYDDYQLYEEDDNEADDDNTYATKFIDYINECNSAERIKTRTRLINQHNIIHEHYMRRMMHPDRLAALKEDETLDVDEFMTQYVDSL